MVGCRRTFFLQAQSSAATPPILVTATTFAITGPSSGEVQVDFDAPVSVAGWTGSEFEIDVDGTPTWEPGTGVSQSGANGLLFTGGPTWAALLTGSPWQLVSSPNPLVTIPQSGILG